MGGAIISELGGGIIPLQRGGIIPELGGGFLRNQQLPPEASRRTSLAVAKATQQDHSAVDVEQSYSRSFESLFVLS
jgi:hypothetical protein